MGVKGDSGEMDITISADLEGIVVVAVLSVYDEDCRGNKPVEVFVAKSKRAVNKMICEKHNIPDGDIAKWISRAWGTISYHKTKTASTL